MPYNIANHESKYAENNKVHLYIEQILEWVRESMVCMTWEIVAHVKGRNFDRMIQVALVPVLCCSDPYVKIELIDLKAVATADNVVDCVYTKTKKKVRGTSKKYFFSL